MNIPPRTFPSPTLPPPAGGSDPSQPLTASGPPPKADVVALVIDDPVLWRDVEDSLSGGPLKVVGREGVSQAAVVIAEVQGDVRTRMAGIRRVAPADAGIVAVVGSGAAATAAYEAGAFACIHTPVQGPDLQGLVASAVDTHESKARASELARRLDADAHLASIGRIGAGLAHELANPLGIAAMNLDVARVEYNRLAEDGRLGASVLGPALQDLGTSLLRIQALLSNLRPFVGSAPPELEPVRVLDVIDRVVRWAQESLLGVDVERHAEPLVALADVTMLEQILLNLTTNAARAAKSLPSPRVRYHLYAAGDVVVVSVRDNGPGLAEELHEKVFEPFYTTRRDEGGTGLGLALCREYARRMRGSLSLWSAPGRGACFRLSLLSEGGAVER